VVWWAIPEGSARQEEALLAPEGKSRGNGFSPARTELGGAARRRSVRCKQPPLEFELTFFGFGAGKNRKRIQKPELKPTAKWY
jgi:hypothetical protein